MYATVVDVQAMNTGRPAFTASSKPNASQVGIYCENVTGQLDAVLKSRGYLLPIPATATVSMALLRDATMKGAHALVEIGAPNDARAKQAEQMWQDALKLLQTADLDAPIDPSVGGGLVQHSVASPLLSIASLLPQPGSRFTRTGDV